MCSCWQASKLRCSRCSLNSDRRITKRQFVAEVRPELRTSLEEVMNIVNSKSSHHQLVDARPEGRFDGSTPEPRPGIRSGHIPGSVNVCFKLLQHDDGTMKSDDDLRSVFEAAGVDMNGEKVIVTTCGSGVSAAVDYLALSVLGKPYTHLIDVQKRSLLYIESKSSKDIKIQGFLVSSTVVVSTDPLQSLRSFPAQVSPIRCLCTTGPGPNMPATKAVHASLLTVQ